MSSFEKKFTNFFKKGVGKLIEICYNNIELFCTGDKVEITRKLSSNNGH